MSGRRVKLDHVCITPNFLSTRAAQFAVLYGRKSRPLPLGCFDHRYDDFADRFGQVGPCFDQNDKLRIANSILIAQCAAFCAALFRIGRFLAFSSRYSSPVWPTSNPLQSQGVIGARILERLNATRPGSTYGSNLIAAPLLEIDSEMDSASREFARSEVYA